MAGDSGTNFPVIYSPLEWTFVEDLDSDGLPDTTPGWSFYWIYGGAGARHSNGFNFLFADSSVRWISVSGFVKNTGGLWSRQE